MKAFVILPLLLLTLAPLPAQVTPGLMSYQGRVTDAAGVLIGNTAPVNRDIAFRLYAASTGGSALYAETQKVTISGGEFSVLIGNGTGITGSPGPSSPASPTRTLADIVNAGTYTSLYLGITVDDGTAAADLEMSPRQQLVSGAFSLRSKVSESVAAGAITTAMLGDGQILNAKLAPGAVDGSRILDLSITAGDILNNTITANKLDPATVGLWTPSGASIYRNSNVGIGTPDPTAKLQVIAATGSSLPHENGICVYNPNNAANNNAVLGLRTAGSSSGNPFVSYDVAGVGGWSVGLDNMDGQKLKFSADWSSLTTNTRMTLDRGGNLGLGTNTPRQKLDIVGGMNATGTLYAPGYSFNGGGDADGGMYSTADGTLQLRTNAVDRLWINNIGQVGIATPATSAKLTIGGALEGSAHSPWFNINGGLLSSTENSEVHLGSFGFASTNHSSLGISGFRARPGSDWTSSALILGMDVDNSIRAGSWLSLGTSGVGVKTLDQSQGVLSVNGGIVSVGSRNGAPGYARMVYDPGGAIIFEGYNTWLNNGQWRGFSMDGNNDLDWRSDRRLKKDIVDAEPMLERLMRLPFRRYRWKDNPDKNQRPEFGVIAQEVEPLFPDLIGKGKDGILTVGYTSFATIACRAIQELKTRTDAATATLAKDVKAVESRLGRQLAEKDRKIADLEARLATLEKAFRTLK